MEKVNIEEAVALLEKPKRGPGGRTSLGGKLVKEFIASGAVFARERFTNEADRKAAMLSVKKYLKDNDLEETIWPQADGHTILFANLAIGQSVPELGDAYQAFKFRYQNVGKGRVPKGTKKGTKADLENSLTNK